MEIKQKLAPINANGARSGIKRTSNGGVTIHNTGNYSKGAGARNHGEYLQNGGANTQVSWHYAVDDKEIIQSIPTNEVAWHAGDGRGNGNMTTTAIEICVNPDCDIAKATDNAAWLAAQDLKAQGLGVDRLYQHNHWSGKNCPAELRAGNPYDWATFKNKVASYLGQSPQPAPVAPKPSPNLKYTVGTPVCVGQLNTQSDGGKLVSAHNEGVIGRIIEGAAYPYRVDRNGTPIGWVNDVIIDADPHTPGAAPKPSAPKPSAPKGGTVTLPASASTWRVYKTNVAPVVGNEHGYLAPAQYGGLTYDIIGRPQANIVTIKTGAFGTVNIFVGPGTGAIIK